MTEPLPAPPSDAREALLTDLAERALNAMQPEIDRLRTNLTNVFHQLKAAERGRHATLAGCCVMLGMPEDTAEPDVFEAIRRLRADIAEMTRLHSNALAALYRDDVETDPHLPSVAADAITGMNFDWDDERVVQDIADTVARALQPAFGKLTQERDSLRTELEQARSPVYDNATRALDYLAALDTSHMSTDAIGLGLDIVAMLDGPGDPTATPTPACSCAAEPVHQAGCDAADGESR